MLLFPLLVACDPVVIGLDEEADTTASMTWSSRVMTCDDGLVSVDLGRRWQFIQVFTYNTTTDEWTALYQPWQMVDNVLSFECYNDVEEFRVSWVNLP